MANRSRLARIFAALLISMIAGTVALMGLGGNAPSAGGFCLSRYYCLDPVARAVLSETPQYSDRWESIEIYYGGAESKPLISQNMPDDGDLECHFIIFTDADSDGEIQPTEKWQIQQSVRPGISPFGSERTIRVCVLSEKEAFELTDFQRRRLEALVETLCRRFEIAPEYIHYPDDW